MSNVVVEQIVVVKKDMDIDRTGGNENETENQLLKDLVRYQRNFIDMEFSEAGRSGVNYAVRSIEARKWIEDYYKWADAHPLSFPFPSLKGIDRLSREQLEEYRVFNDQVINHFSEAKRHASKNFKKN